MDALKKHGIFDKEAQLEALRKSKDKALSLLSASAKDVLTEVYGNLDAYLETKIEAEVWAQKRQGNIITLGEPCFAELKEAPDVTNIVAAGI